MIHGDEAREKKELAVLCDFDGTITLTDTLEYILRKFAVGDWRSFDEKYERGEITLQECLRSQGRLVRTPEMVLVAGDGTSYRVPAQLRQTSPVL